MKRRMRAIAVLLSFAMLLTACGDPYPDMSEEQQEVITRYAAQQLIEHNKGYKSDIVDITDYVYVEPTVTPAPTIAPTTEPTKEPEKVDADLGLGGGDSASTEKPTFSLAELSSFLELDNVAISFADYTFGTKYPASEEAVYLYTEADKGKKLLAVRFNITNLTDETVTCDLAARQAEFAVVSGEDLKKAALYTYLENDMSWFEEDLSAHETKDAVLILQVPESQKEQYDSMVLRVRYNGEIRQFTIY